MKYLISDHLALPECFASSTVAITDSTGGVLSETSYAERSGALRHFHVLNQVAEQPFGEPRADAGSLAGTDKTYTGQRDVPDTGLMDYKARMYSAQLGRFIQPDTIVPGAGNSQAWNRYAYVLNRPINYTDPSGHKVCDAKNGLNDCISTKEVQQVIQKLYGWTLIGSWSSKETDNVLVTATNMEDSLRIITGSSGKHWMENNIGKVNIKKGNVSCPPYKCNYSNPFPYTNQVVMNSGTMNDLETGRHILVHEIAHLIDKNSGYLKMGTLFGGGYSDQMVMDLGGDPTRSASGGYRASGLGTIGKNGVSLFRDAIFRFEWGGFEMPEENKWKNVLGNIDVYGDQDGPDYFANAFAYTLFGSPNVVVPQNASNWMNSFLQNTSR